MRRDRHSRGGIGCGGAGQSGFIYLALLLAVAILTGVIGATVQVWATAIKHEKEQELLFIGQQFRRAFELYYNSSSGMGQRYPRRLEDLLKDPRHPGVRRYLRKIFVDPITGTAEWGLVKSPDGTIVGVHSLSEEEPLKKAEFGRNDKDFEGRQKYSEWVFLHRPRGMTAPAIITTPNQNTALQPGVANKREMFK